MIDYTNCRIEQVAVHRVGNKTNFEELELSKGLLDTSKEKVGELLFRYFLAPFNQEEFYSFTFSNGDHLMNPLRKFAVEIFDDPQALLKNSADIARHLFELSTHPQIKSGDLFVAYFTGISSGTETTDAIGIFKSENRQPYLKLESEKGDFDIRYETGINIEKLDKGCLIFNEDRDSGYKISIIDKSNKSDAQYWKDTFLQLRPRSDEYHNTKNFLSIAKNYVTKQITDEFEVSKADQIDLLNRSVDYFKKHEQFDKEEFAQEVFHDSNVIESFKKFDESYRTDHEMELTDQFDISPQAVKKQARVFKSVLKLDKNFHIYIHGNRELIEQGIDEQGRKFYKIYYREEH